MDTPNTGSEVTLSRGTVSLIGKIVGLVVTVAITFGGWGTALYFRHDDKINEHSQAIAASVATISAIKENTKTTADMVEAQNAKIDDLVDDVNELKTDVGIIKRRVR